MNASPDIGDDDGLTLVSHPEPAHIDDVVGLALLLERRDGRGRILRPAYQGPEIDAWADAARSGRDVALVDVGGRDDPPRFFDHHQDLALPCAAVLVARALGYTSFVQSPAARFMSVKDTRGFAAAARKCGERPPPAINLAESWITAGVARPDPEEARAIASVCAAPFACRTYGRFITELHDALPERSLARGREILARRREEEMSAIRSAAIVRIGDLCLAVGSAPLPFAARAYDLLSADLLVSPTPDARGVCITRDSRKRRLARLDLSRAGEATGRRVVFVHKSGFLVILEGSPEGLDLEALVRGIGRAGRR